jgi:shikimate kinase
MTRQAPGAQLIILVGFMGAGKTTVGRALADELGWTFEDLDDRIERRERRKVAEIFRHSGEDEFRRAEHLALQELLEELAGTPRVVALGGGAFVQAVNASLIEAAEVPTVFLDAGVEELWRRCREQAERDGAERPLLGGQERFRELYEMRRPHYLKASLRQETGGKAMKEIVAEIRQALGLGSGGKQRGETK